MSNAHPLWDLAAMVSTPEGKREFVRRLCDAVRDEILADVGAMPDGWDGHELRRYIAQEFAVERTAMPMGRVRRFNVACASVTLARWQRES